MGKILDVQPIVPNSIVDKLWEWTTTPPTNGTVITLPKPISDYEYLMVVFVTNAERKTQLIPVADIVNTHSWMEHAFAVYSGSGQVSNYPLMDACFLTFNLTENKITIVLDYTDTNWQLKPKVIYGIRKASFAEFAQGGVTYQNYVWSNVAITAYGEGLYYTGSASRKDVAISGYKPISAEVTDWVGASDMFNLYIGGQADYIGAYSKTSQTVSAIYLRVGYAKV